MERPLQKSHIAEQIQIATGRRISLDPAALAGEQHERKIGPFRLFANPSDQRLDVLLVDCLFRQNSEPRPVAQTLDHIGQ